MQTVAKICKETTVSMRCQHKNFTGPAAFSLVKAKSQELDTTQRSMINLSLGTLQHVWLAVEICNLIYDGLDYSIRFRILGNNVYQSRNGYTFFYWEFPSDRPLFISILNIDFNRRDSVSKVDQNLSIAYQQTVDFHDDFSRLLHDLLWDGERENDEF